MTPAINRRTFLQATAAVGLTGYALRPAAAAAGSVPASRTLVANYFRAHTYTMVPANIRQDLDWMVAHGTDAVALAILEQDLSSALQNVTILCREAHQRGLRVYAVPARWGGLVLGEPQLPSTFCAANDKNDDYYLLGPDGTPPRDAPGPYASVHVPAVADYFRSTLATILGQWPFDGLIWDRPTTLTLPDYNPAAVAAKPPGATNDWYTDTVAAFFDDLSRHAKTINPELMVGLQLPAGATGHQITACARLTHLDYFGCAGRPWTAHDDHSGDPDVLLPNAQAFVDAAGAAGKTPLLGMQNVYFERPAPYYYALLPRRVPQVAATTGTAAAVLSYHYYGPNTPDPDTEMRLLGISLDKLPPRRPTAR